jgi:hypothetical protein
MKVLVATKRSYTEFCWAKPGELVLAGFAVCANPGLWLRRRMVWRGKPEVH